MILPIGLRALPLVRSRVSLASPTSTTRWRRAGGDFALFMVEALENDELVHEAPAIVGRQTPSVDGQP